MTRVPPFRTVGRLVMFSAAVWNSGADSRVTSPVTKSPSTRVLKLFQMRFPWVSTAPLARPVVPDV